MAILPFGLCWYDRQLLFGIPDCRPTKRYYLCSFLYFALGNRPIRQESRQPLLGILGLGSPIAFADLGEHLISIAVDGFFLPDHMRRLNSLHQLYLGDNLVSVARMLGAQIAAPASMNFRPSLSGSGSTRLITRGGMDKTT